MPSSETDSSTLNEDNSNTTTKKIVNKDATNTSGLGHNEDTDAQASLLRLTRRHSLPASYHLSTFLSFFNQNGADSTHESSNVNEAHNSSRTPPQVNTIITRHTRSATASGLVGQTTPRSNVNRHRYGHRHTRSVVNQPVVVRTYNPPATLRVPTRAGMMNPAIFEVCPWPVQLCCSKMRRTYQPLPAFAQILMTAWLCFIGGRNPED